MPIYVVRSASGDTISSSFGPENSGSCQKLCSKATSVTELSQPDYMTTQVYLDCPYTTLIPDGAGWENNMVVRDNEIAVYSDGSKTNSGS